MRVPPGADDRLSYDRLRFAVDLLSKERGEWAGIPIPLNGEQLIVEPSYRYARLSELNAPKPDPADDGWKLRNSWYSFEQRCRILVMESPDGKITWGKEPAANHLSMDIRTVGCTDAWGIPQETAAQQTLSELVSTLQFKQYVMTGMFLERSKRSSVTYIFRRLRPTVALHAVKGSMNIMCTLCLHPIAYYAGTWAGTMVPTDDVLAHLMLMRGDEAMFWRRANQHPSWAPQSGL